MLVYFNFLCFVLLLVLFQDVLVVKHFVAVLTFNSSSFFVDLFFVEVQSVVVLEPFVAYATYKASFFSTVDLSYVLLEALVIFEPDSAHWAQCFLASSGVRR